MRVLKGLPVWVLVGIKLSVFLVCISSRAQATPIVFFVFTGKTGAQTQTDMDHVTVWYPNSITPPADAGAVHYTNISLPDFDPTSDWYLGGFELDMKNGSKSSEGVTLSLWDGGIGVNLVDSVFVNDSNFTQQYGPIDFLFGSPDLIASGHHYIVTLTSTAADSQSDAYFIKGTGALAIQDSTRTQTLDVAGSEIIDTQAVPEPASWLLMAGGAGAIWIGRKRRNAK